MIIRSVFAFTFSALLTVLQVPKTTNAQTQNFDLNDLGKIVNLSDPQISPDGSSVLFITARPDYDENRFERKLVFIELPEGNPRTLTFERPDVRSPRWSPDGSKIGFIAYPIPGHFPGDPIHQRDVYRRWVTWIRDHFSDDQVG